MKSIVCVISRSAGPKLASPASHVADGSFGLGLHLTELESVLLHDSVKRFDALRLATTVAECLSRLYQETRIGAHLLSPATRAVSFVNRSTSSSPPFIHSASVQLSQPVQSDALSCLR